jgi:hypothetical protein
LWKSITDEYDLGEHELVLLRQAVAVADTCEALQATIAAEGLSQDGHKGRTTHWALRELRVQRILLARLIVALRVPLGAEEDGQGRAQYRGPRGVYQPRGVPG